MDLLGLTIEGEHRLATRTERLEQTMQNVGEKLAQMGEKLTRLEETTQEIGDKLNGLISVVDGIIRKNGS